MRSTAETLGWASECPDVKNHKWPLNPVWHRMPYSCTHTATVGVKGLKCVAMQTFAFLHAMTSTTAIDARHFGLQIHVDATQVLNLWHEECNTLFTFQKLSLICTQNDTLSSTIRFISYCSFSLVSMLLILLKKTNSLVSCNSLTLTPTVAIRVQLQSIILCQTGLSRHL